MNILLKLIFLAAAPAFVFAAARRDFQLRIRFAGPPLKDCEGRQAAKRDAGAGEAAKKYHGEFARLNFPEPAYSE